MLTVRGVSKQYGDIRALDGVDLDIAPGQICGLLGANGAGKTTLISIVAGLRRPDSGSVVVNGVDVLTDPRRARKNLGLAPQDLGIYPVLSVRSNLRFFAELAQMRASAIDDAIEQTVLALGLMERIDSRAGDLSGGQKRRLHTALAMIHRPPLLLLDEPTVGADVQSRVELLALVDQLAREGCAVCYTTHYLAEIETLEARVSLLHEGKILVEGQVGELVDRYGSGAIVIEFGGRVPAVLARKPGATRTAGTSISVPIGKGVGGIQDLITVLSPTQIKDIRAIEVVKPSLEAVYLSLTGTTLAEYPDASLAQTE